MAKLKPVLTDNAPKPIGPYSQAIEAGEMVFVSGQIPLDPKTGALLDGDVQDQTRLVMNNLKAVLLAAGCSMDQVAKTTIFVKDMNDFGKINEVYGEFFGDVAPARATVEVARLPKDVKVEIDCVAVR